MVLSRYFIFFTIFFNFLARDCDLIKKDSIVVYWHDRHCKKYNILKDWVRDIAVLNARLFSPRVLRPISLCIPIYFAAREADDNVNCIFYDKHKHKDLSNVPKCVTKFVSASAAVAGFSFAAIQLFTSKPDLRLSSDIFSKGAFSIWLTKNLIKNTVHLKICQRPKCGEFDPTCIYYGGFPSGHQAIATYLASFFWMRHGPKWGVPLSLYAGAIFGAGLAGNRHYISQLIGGAILGLAFTFSSKWIIKAKVCSHAYCTPKFDKNGVGMELSCSF